MVNRKYIIVGIAIAIIGLILTHTYRPYIYENHIYDFHIADTIGSLVCVPSFTLFYYGFSNKYSIGKVVFITTVVYILYELPGLFNIHGTFDFHDIIATTISGVCSYFILNASLKKR